MSFALHADCMQDDLFKEPPRICDSHGGEGNPKAILRPSHWNFGEDFEVYSENEKAEFWQEAEAIKNFVFC